MKRLISRLDHLSPKSLAWLLFAVWLGYSGAALAWLHLQDPPTAYCTAPRSQ